MTSMWSGGGSTEVFTEAAEREKDWSGTVWQSWLSTDTGLKPLQDEILVYFKDDIWERFQRTMRTLLAIDRW
ncbi:hypothetical protein AAFF_G00069120 [Aldrovandia affinis]|uniref:Uncharacterized protein n=1 Tax=Aldrovandia affinis TaxID=143900 RepID=A0AAD7RZ48_9TELE|nr:hypothetical protein AAFF_G00069120 [Aldrovandia affinis]